MSFTNPHVDPDLYDFVFNYTDVNIDPFHVSGLLRSGCHLGWENFYYGE